MTSRPPQYASSNGTSNRLAGDERDHVHLLDAAATRAAAELLNKRNAAANSSIDFSLPSQDTLPDGSAASTPPYPGSQIQFRANTIAPSPPLLECSPTLSTPRQTTEPNPDEHQHRYHPSPLGSGGAGGNISLHLQTDIHPAPPVRTDSLNNTANLSSTRPSALVLQHKTSASSLKPVSRTPSFKTAALASSFGTWSATSSAVPSPIISAMGDVTPLPSPLLSSDSPGPWKRLGGRPPSFEAPSLQPISSESALVTSNGESIAAALAHQTKRKAYAGLSSGDGEAGADAASGDKQAIGLPHMRTRSISEYVPDPLLLPKRMTTVSGPRVKTDGTDGETPFEPHMRREPHLSEARGLTPVEKPPTPPPSESSLSATDSSVTGSGSSATSKKPRYEYFEARGRLDHKRRRWRAIKLLGQGTFSRVMLATSQISSSASDDDDYSGSSNSANGGNGLLTPEPQPHYNRRTLVAVKICEHGPRGGASEDRVEMSLKRELEIMQSINHPSLVHLKAWNIEPTRAILVLSYCPGGDLFDVASSHRHALTPPLLRRIFSELVGAVRYLHERRIVHRDIKLENVLVNLPASELTDPSTDWQAYPYSVITLTDLGLSRRIADDERLETRCGSDDYAAPEVIMGQPYDGRATDAWSLGVLLYALLEGRLPFDPLPGTASEAAAAMRMRSRTSHRIARVEWRWVEYAGDEGDHEGDRRKFEERGLLGAMEIAEGLLKRARSRWPLEKVAATQWVSGGIEVEGGGGIRFREEEEGEEVL